MKSRRMAVLAAVSILTPATLAATATPALARDARPSAATPDTAPDTTPDPATAEARDPSGALVTARVTGLPQRFVAGGDWQEFTLTLDNAGSEEIRDLSVGLVWYFDEDDPGIRTDQVGIQMLVDGAWQDQTFFPGQAPQLLNSNPVLYGRPFPPGTSTLPLRMKFTEDTPTQLFSFSAGVNVEHGEQVASDWGDSEIVRPAAPDPDPEPTPDPKPTPDPESTPDPKPTPDPGSDPAPAPDPSHEAGTGGGAGGGGGGGDTGPATGGSGATPAPEGDADGGTGGQLAATGGGIGPWPLVGGTAVTLGTVLTLLARARRRGTGDTP
ncbi:hypothetical protein [Streptomyces sp. NPDC090025]|uniref:hypothetical protein n=1 Tax=Streptomyces sp. NPDC090025 TaxID=3365922 RepID=UPI003834CCC4